MILYGGVIPYGEYCTVNASGGLLPSGTYVCDKERRGEWKNVRLHPSSLSGWLTGVMCLTTDIPRMYFESAGNCGRRSGLQGQREVGCGVITPHACTHACPG